MTALIRAYRETDRDRLRAMTVAAFEGVSIDHNIDERLRPAVALDWRARKGRHVDDDVDTPGGEVAVAEDPGTGLALGYVSMRFDRASKVGWVPNLAVAEGARGAGLGRALLEHALRRFRDEGMAVARIETLEQNPVGRHLYPSVGFREVARQIHYAVALDANDPPRPVPPS